MDVTLENGASMQFKSCIYAYDNSLEVLTLGEKRWSLSEFIKSDSFKAIEQSTVSEEKELEYDNQDRQTALGECVRQMGFTELPSLLPKSFLMAISNRFTYDQAVKRNCKFLGQRMSFPPHCFRGTLMHT